MPYNIYDNRGNKVGQVTSPAEEVAGLVFLFILFIYALPGLIVIWLAVLGYIGLTQVYWPWAKSIHHLTPYSNLNGVITCLTIPLIAFLVCARWEKIARGETGILAEFALIASLTYSAIAIVSAVPIILDTRPHEVYKWFLVAPFAMSALTYLRFKPIRIIVSLLITIPLAILSLCFIVWIAWMVIDAVVGWLLR